MADDKIVTKKTAAKPAETAKKAPAKAATPAKAVTKKAAPKPAAPPAPEPRAAKAPSVSMPARSAAPAPAPAPASAAASAHKAPPPKPKPTEPPLADPDVHPVPLEEKPVSLHGLAGVTPEQRLAMIREAAYYKAEKRGFTGDNDAQDWVESEREIDDLLAKARQIYGG